MRYAENTQVASDRSRSEIEKILQRYGATAFMYGWQEEAAVIAFEMCSRRIRFQLPMPRRDDPEFKNTPGGRRRRNDSAAFVAWEQACRQRWRALALVIKAKLEAVESGITEFENEFMAHILLPDGKTVAQHVRPNITLAYDSGKMPRLLIPAEVGA